MALTTLLAGSGASWSSMSSDTFNNLAVGTTTDYGVINVVGGWWLCFALGNDFLWAQSTGTCLKLTSAGELAISINRTTDTQWFTSGLAFPTSKWVFIATAIYTANGLTTPTSDVSATLWYGTELLPPSSQSLSLVVGGAGSIVSDTAFAVNCSSATSAALSGYASQIHVHSTTADISGTSVSQNIIDETYKLYVQPMWNGTFNPHAVHGRRADGLASFSPRTEGDNWSSTLYIPFDAATVVANNTYWPAYSYTTNPTAGIVKSYMSSASTNGANNYVGDEPPASRYRRITTDATEPSLLLNRV